MKEAFNQLFDKSVKIFRRIFQNKENYSIQSTKQWKYVISIQNTKYSTAYVSPLFNSIMRKKYTPSLSYFHWRAHHLTNLHTQWFCTTDFNTKKHFKHLHKKPLDCFSSGGWKTENYLYVYILNLWAILMLENLIRNTKCYLITANVYNINDKAF